jgi:SAM-dependent methyltransferase
MISDKWQSPEYVQGIENCFNIVDKYLTQPPKYILDIGCGFAGVSEMFQKKYGTELWLLEGDVDTTSSNTRKAKYGEVSDFKFYLPLDTLHDYWNSRELKYNFVDANNIQLNKDIKFDLVYSRLSCGYHYPVAAYKKLILDHTNPESKIIMDFRRKSISAQQSDIEIINYLEGNELSKRVKLHIKLKETEI